MIRIVYKLRIGHSVNDLAKLCTRREVYRICSTCWIRYCHGNDRRQATSKYIDRAADISDQTGSRIQSFGARVVKALDSHDTILITPQLDNHDHMNQYTSRDLSLDDLEKILKNQDPLSDEACRTRQSLLKLYCQVPRTPGQELLKEQAKIRVEQLQTDITKSSHTLSSKLLAYLMDFYVQCGETKKALEIKSQIPSSYSIYPHFIMDLAALVVRSGNIQDGTLLIKEEIAKRKSLRNPLADYRPRPFKYSADRFLTAVAQATGDPEVVQEAIDMITYFTQGRIITPILCSRVKVHLVNKDYDSAVEEFCKCCDKHHFAPLRQELMKALINNQDSNNLERLVAANAQLFSMENTMQDLAFAHAAVGKIDVAKEIFSKLDPQSISIRLPMLCETHANKYPQNFKKLFEATLQVIPSSQSEEMLHHLLQVFLKNNDIESAIHLWECVKDHSTVISVRNASLFSSIFTKEGKEAPIELKTASQKGDIKIIQTSRSHLTHHLLEDNDELSQAIESQNIPLALSIKERRERQGLKVSLIQYAEIIDALLHDEKIEEAYNEARRLLESRVYPRSQTIRHLLLRLSDAGNPESILNLPLPKYITDNTWFSANLMRAYINGLMIDELIDKVLPTLSPFPLVEVLGLCNQWPDIEDKIRAIIGEKLKREELNSKDIALALECDIIPRGGSLFSWLHQTRTEGLSDIEHYRLAEALTKEIMRSESRIHMKADQQQYEQFKSLLTEITSNQPLDIVIDGLNMAYKFSERGLLEELVSNDSIPDSKPRDYPTFCVQSLIEIINSNRLVEKCSNIMVIGKKHMIRWSGMREFVNEQAGRISFFFTDNEANDDAFILMAAMRHPKTLLLTEDSFKDVRKALSLVDSENQGDFETEHANECKSNVNFQHDFRRWYRTHKVFVTNSKKLIFPLSSGILSEPMNMPKLPNYPDQQQNKPSISQSGSSVQNFKPLLSRKKEFTEDCLSNLSIEELESLLNEQEPNSRVARRARRALISKYSQEARKQGRGPEFIAQAKERVDSIFSRANHYEDVLSPEVLTTIMMFYNSAGDIEKAFEVKSRIPADFMIYPHHIFDLATTLVRCGKIIEALAFIEEEVQKKTIRAALERNSSVSFYRSDGHLRTSIDRFLTSLAELSRDPTIIKNIIDMVMPLMDKEPAASILANLIRVHLLNDDAQSAVDEFCRYCEEYKLAPLRGDLMKHLLMKQDFQNLDRVIEANAQLFGKRHTMLDLAFVKVGIGDIEGAKRIFETQELNSPRFPGYCEIYSSKHPDNFKKLIQATPGIFKAIQREEMYFNLYKVYLKNHEADKVLELLNIMQEEGLPPSPRIEILLTGQGLNDIENCSTVTLDKEEIPPADDVQTPSSKSSFKSVVADILSDDDSLPSTIRSVHVAEKVNQLISQSKTNHSMMDECIDHPIAKKINHFEELLKRQHPPLAHRTRITLIANYCKVPRQSELEPLKDQARKRIDKLTEELENSKIHLSPKIMVPLMDFYALTGNVDKALCYKSKIPSHFKIDQSKILDLAAHLVRCGRYGSGVSLIEEEIRKRGYPTPSVPKDGFQINKFTPTNASNDIPSARSANRFLSAVAEATKDPKLVRDGIKLVMDYTEESPNNSLYSSLIKVYLLNDDIEEAVAKFLECCQRYRFAPYRLELIKALLVKGDGEKLEKVLQANSELYRIGNTMLDLALAYIELGRIDEAKQTFQSLKVHLVNSERLLKFCETYVNNGRIRELESLIKISQGLVDLLDREEMYHHLLRLCFKMNDPQKALQVAKCMKEEGLPINARNSRLLSKIAERNDIKLSLEELNMTRR